MISAEYEPQSPHVTLDIGNEALVAYLQDGNEAGAALKEADPVKWLVGTIALAKGEMPQRLGTQILWHMPFWDKEVWTLSFTTKQKNI